MHRESAAFPAVDRHVSARAVRCERSWRLSTAWLIPVIAAASFLQALGIALRLAQTSDSAQGFVVAHAMVRGNFLLSGWHFPVDDYYFTDTFPYAALEWIAGARPFLLALVPALTYALFVLAALVVCVRSVETTDKKWTALAVVSLLLGAPAWIGDWNPLLLSDMHMATIVGAFAVLVLCARIGDREQSRLTVCVALPIIVALTLASDPFALVFAYGPALVLLLIDFFRRRSRRAPAALLCLIIGIALGATLPFVFASLGGFTVENDVATSPIPGSLLLRNLLSMAAGIFTLFGITPALHSGVHGLALLVLRSAGFLMVVVSIARVARNLVARMPLLDRLLCAGILTDLVACAASAQFAKGIPAHSIWAGGPPMRFLMPTFLFGAFLAGRQIPAMVSALRNGRIRRLATAFAVSFAAILLAVGGWLSGVNSQPCWMYDNPPAAIAGWLERHGLSQGVGEYWSANLLTAMSGNRVEVRSVVPLEGKLLPYVWVTDARSYARVPQFMIWQDENKTGVTLAQVRASFPVCRMEQIGRFRIALLATTCTNSVA